MHWSRRLLPLLLLAGLAGSASLSPARAQAPSARFAFADTTLLRDTLDLTFADLFRLADSLRVKPDSLRAVAIRLATPIERLAFLADSLGMPIDSVGPVLAREQFNPLSRRADDVQTFAYNSTYNVSRQSTSWGNNVTYDLAHGPVVLHNVTSVRVDRIPEAGKINFHRSKSASTEAGWKVLPDIALGVRINLQRTETFRLGSERITSQNDFQGSLRTKHDFGRNRTVDFNWFGGPFNEPRNSLNNASKRGLGTNAEGRIEYAPQEWYSLALNGNSTYRRGRSQVPTRATFDTRDLRWATDGTLSLFPNSRASLRVNSSFDHDLTERPTAFTRIRPASGSAPADTSRLDQLVQEPSGSARVQTALQLQGGRFGSLNLTGSLGRTTRLLTAEQKTGLRFDRQVNDERDITADGQFGFAGWSMDAHATASQPEEEGPRRSIVNVNRGSGAVETVPIDYRERGTTRTRSMNGSLTRRLSRHVNLKARGDIGLTTYRYAISDSAYLALTGGERIPTSDPHDDYRQTLRLETTYSTSANFSSTVGLELARILSIYLRSDRSATNREDRLYRAEWLWTYRLLRGLTANQRDQINATYSRSLFSPGGNRLSLSYSTITTLNARITPRLTVDLTHNASYGPSGTYNRAGDGFDYFIISDATRDYTLTGRIGYAPVPSFTLNLQPSYQANYRDDRSSGGPVPTLRRKQLGLTGGASLNIRVRSASRLSGNISRNLDSRRDTPYRFGVAQLQPRSESDYWSGALSFAWSLK